MGDIEPLERSWLPPSEKPRLSPATNDPFRLEMHLKIEFHRHLKKGSIHQKSWQF